MTTSTEPPPAALVGRSARWLLRTARRGVPDGLEVLVRLVLLGLVVAVAIFVAPATVPLTSLMVPLLLGSLLLDPRQTPWFVGYVAVLLAVSLARQPDITARTLVAVAIEVLMCAIVLVFSGRRSGLGVGAGRGESMFVDLRDRILGQGGIPDLPGGWHVESAIRSAGGTAFAGDFVLATTPTPTRLEVVVVDVSGKGEQAGTRALLLSGALGGLLGALPAERFLPAANDYLVRLDWEEGFATAVHLSVDLAGGDVEVRTAGHPPALLRRAGSGRWSVLGSQGPALGLAANADFTVGHARLRHGDAVMLYTDGMVEDQRLDIDLGIDRMLGEAERLLRGSFDGAAERLVDAVGSRDDDRTMLVVSRS